MSDLSVVLIGSFPPRRCGIATFTSDLARSLAAQPGIRTSVLAIEPPGESYAYGREVIGRIRQEDPPSYTRAIELAARAGADVICIQHEHGLWGVWDKDHLDSDNTVAVLEAAASRRPPIPVVTTLHTIRPHPDALSRQTLRGIIEHSGAVVVMVRTGAMILMDDYGVSPDKLVRIPHGVPVVEAKARRFFKRRLGLEGRTIISTFGLINPRKGIEYAIRAMRRVAQRHPEALYLVVGETHPELRKSAGEAYRNQLQLLVRKLGIQDHVQFVNQYLTDRQLIDYLQASDIYVTPYLDRTQITSGTLAFAVGTGKAIISTPYPHATEALAEGRGLLAEFRSADSLAKCLVLMLDNPELRRTWEGRTVEYGKGDLWPLVGEHYARLLRRVVDGVPYSDMLAVSPDQLAAGTPEPSLADSVVAEPEVERDMVGVRS